MTRIAAVFFIMMGQRIYTFATSFIDDSLSVSISLEIVSIDKLYYFQDRIRFPNIGWHGNKKRQFFSYHSNGCYKENNSSKFESYRFKPPLQKVG